jgi:glycosyltransferase involved in cell wall biosynthesis
MVPDISVILCTRNRAASLDTALRSLTACATADLNWELLVIDNGSTDQTALVAASYHDRLPIRTILEPTAGLSHARNRGVAEATGEWLVWLDDDVTVP